VLDLLLEELVIHDDFSQLLLQPDDPKVPGVRGALLQYRLASPEKLLAPHGEPDRSNAQLSAEQLQVLITPKTQDDLDFSPDGKPRRSSVRHPRAIFGGPTARLCWLWRQTTTLHHGASPLDPLFYPNRCPKEL
jgi:hypothetical protein